MIRTEVRFAPCKTSAVQGLRLASRDGTGGVDGVCKICNKSTKAINKQFFQSIDVNTDKYMRILHSLGLVGLPISTMKLTVSWY